MGTNKSQKTMMSKRLMQSWYVAHTLAFYYLTTTTTYLPTYLPTIHIIMLHTYLSVDVCTNEI